MRKGQIHPWQPGTSVYLFGTAHGERLGWPILLCMSTTHIHSRLHSHRRLSPFPIYFPTCILGGSQQGSLIYSRVEPQRAIAPQDPEGESFNRHHDLNRQYHVYSSSINYTDVGQISATVLLEVKMSAAARATGCKHHNLKTLIGWRVIIFTHM